jgi:hypothetical protein
MGPEMREQKRHQNEGLSLAPFQGRKVIFQENPQVHRDQVVESV